MKPYYEDSSCQILHGDCREILPSIGKVDLVLTDPPYGIGFAAQPTTGQRKRGQPIEQWDNQTFHDLLLFLPACPAIIWGGNYYSLPLTRCWLAWVKPDAPPSMGGLELAWTSFDALSDYISCSIAQTNPERVGHPTQKPLKVITWCLSFAPDAQTILNPFMGSGTTLVAAKQLGRRAIGIELCEAYCEIAANRLSQEYLPLSAPSPEPEPERLLSL